MLLPAPAPRDMARANRFSRPRSKEASTALLWRGTAHLPASHTLNDGKLDVLCKPCSTAAMLAQQQWHHGCTTQGTRRLQRVCVGPQYSPGPLGVFGRLPLREGLPALMGVTAGGISVRTRPASALALGSATTVTGPDRSTSTACSQKNGSPRARSWWALSQARQERRAKVCLPTLTCVMSASYARQAKPKKFLRGKRR